MKEEKEKRENDYFYQESRNKKTWIPAFTNRVWDVQQNGEPYVLASGKVIAVILKTREGNIYSSDRKKTHLQLLQLFQLDATEVTKTGWRLEGGTEIWK